MIEWTGGNGVVVVVVVFVVVVVAVMVVVVDSWVTFLFWICNVIFCQQIFKIYKSLYIIFWF